mmetsp:Transcript_44321/g.87492  ORF Transcript_44321/g.87492 Transcript_44321/m.87492 type:complete len:213 (-) Transcript_44321:1005-1643(-)
MEEAHAFADLSDNPSAFLFAEIPVNTYVFQQIPPCKQRKDQGLMPRALLHSDQTDHVRPSPLVCKVVQPAENGPLLSHRASGPFVFRQDFVGVELQCDGNFRFSVDASHNYTEGTEPQDPFRFHDVRPNRGRKVFDRRGPLRLPTRRPPGRRPGCWRPSAVASFLFAFFRPLCRLLLLLLFLCHSLCLPGREGFHPFLMAFRPCSRSCLGSW